MGKTGEVKNSNFIEWIVQKVLQRNGTSSVDAIESVNSMNYVTVLIDLKARTV